MFFGQLKIVVNSGSKGGWYFIYPSFECWSVSMVGVCVCLSRMMGGLRGLFIVSFHLILFFFILISGANGVGAFNGSASYYLHM